MGFFETFILNPCEESFRSFRVWIFGDVVPKKTNISYLFWEKKVPNQRYGCQAIDAGRCFFFWSKVKQLTRLSFCSIWGFLSRVAAVSPKVRSEYRWVTNTSRKPRGGSDFRRSKNVRRGGQISTPTALYYIVSYHAVLERSICVSK